MFLSFLESGFEFFAGLAQGLVFLAGKVELVLDFFDLLVEGDDGLATGTALDAGNGGFGLAEFFFQAVVFNHQVG